MKLATCDFCPKTKAKPRGDCLSTTIDGRVYDICPPCKTARDKQLQGKGAVAYDSGTIGVNYSSLEAGHWGDSGGTFYGVRPPVIPRGTAAGDN